MSDELDQMSEEERAVMEQWENMADDDAPEADVDSILEADATPAFDGCLLYTSPSPRDS